MAELAVSAFAAMAGSAGSAAAATSAASWLAGTTVTTAAGATTALGASTALGSGVLGALSTTATVASMISTLVGGYAAYRSSQDQAAIQELNADAAMLEARERALRIRREEAQKVGAARVAFAASGLDISSGQAIEGGYGTEADFESSLALNAGRIGAAGGRGQAAATRTRGTMGLVQAGVRAGTTYADNRLSIARRG